MDANKQRMPASSSRLAPERTIWTPPRLVRMGSVEALTSKKDLTGRNDGGTLFMRRT